MIRGIELVDLPMIRIRAEGLAAGYYPEFIPDIAREHGLLRELATGNRHYAKAIGLSGDPEAVLMAHEGDNLWATQRHATVLVWYSRTPGAGAKLLRDFVRWARGQKHLVVAGFMDDFDMDARVAVLLRRVGFIQRGGAHVLFPGGSKK